MRYPLLDSIRGAVLLSMILYHGVWDLTAFTETSWDWYEETPGYLWQQSICWSFILLSGYCWSLGRHHLKRGLTVFGAGILVSLVTLLVMPEERILFGILTFLGSAMLILIPLDHILRKVPAWVGIAGSLLLFSLLRNINDGYLGFGAMELFRLPEVLYQGMAATWLGFKEAEFFSTDYFSLLPWFFLFLCGYFIQKGVDKWLRERSSEPSNIMKREIPALSLLGRHSLEIYLIHQPVLTGIVMAWNAF